MKFLLVQLRFECRTVYVAMSGGVDSSVAAALLKRRGFGVIGVFMKPWQPEISKYRNIEMQSSCLWQQDREDALRAAAVLGIPLLTWDFSKEYKKEVGDYMIREYKAGRTPNPDVMCNKEIKFGLFLKKALKEGADYIATGHYVRLRGQTFSLPFARPASSLTAFRRSLSRYARTMPAPSSKRATKVSPLSLLQAVDKNKDQSYFLWTLTQDQLKHCLFPIGEYSKPEVRKLARKFGLPNHDKKDSQGVCFIGPLDMKDFLKKYIKTKPGDIIDTNGQIIGRHDGVYYYTIGQRHGLDIKNGKGPYYVTGKDIKKNIIYVGKEKDLSSREARITDINWICGLEAELPSTWKPSFRVDVKVRYRSKSEKVTLFRSLTPKQGLLRFKNPIRAITPGQSAVFYKGQELLGGGIIN